MNIKQEIQGIIDVQNKFIPLVADIIVRNKATHENVKSIFKELKKINYRLDRIRSDLKLPKESVDVSNSGRIDNECKTINQ